MKAGAPEHAKQLYEYIIEECRKECGNVPVSYTHLFFKYCKLPLSIYADAGSFYCHSGNPAAHDLDSGAQLPEAEPDRQDTFFLMRNAI